MNYNNQGANQRSPLHVRMTRNVFAHVIIEPRLCLRPPNTRMSGTRRKRDTLHVVQGKVNPTLPDSRVDRRCFHVWVPWRERERERGSQNWERNHNAHFNGVINVIPHTFRILISFPSRTCDLARFFLLMHLIATSQSRFFKRKTNKPQCFQHNTQLVWTPDHEVKRI